MAAKNSAFSWSHLNWNPILLPEWPHSGSCVSFVPCAWLDYLTVVQEICISPLCSYFAFIIYILIFYKLKFFLPLLCCPSAVSNPSSPLFPLFLSWNKRPVCQCLATMSTLHSCAERVGLGLLMQRPHTAHHGRMGRTGRIESWKEKVDEGSWTWLVLGKKVNGI